MRTLTLNTSQKPWYGYLKITQSGHAISRLHIYSTQPWDCCTISEFQKCATQSWDCANSQIEWNITITFNKLGGVAQWTLALCITAYQWLFCIKIDIPRPHSVYVWTTFNCRECLAGMRKKTCSRSLCVAIKITSYIINYKLMGHWEVPSYLVHVCW